MNKYFRSEYLATNNISYYDNLKKNLFYAINSFMAGVYFLIHAFIPDIYPNRGISCITSLTFKIHTIDDSYLVILDSSKIFLDSPDINKISDKIFNRLNTCINDLDNIVNLDNSDNSDNSDNLDNSDTTDTTDNPDNTDTINNPNTIYNPDTINNSDTIDNPDTIDNQDTIDNVDTSKNRSCIIA